MGGFRVLACADTGSKDPPWRAPVLSFVFIQIWKNLKREEFIPNKDHEMNKSALLELKMVSKMHKKTQI